MERFALVGLVGSLAVWLGAGACKVEAGHAVPGEDAVLGDAVALDVPEGMVRVVVHGLPAGPGTVQVSTPETLGNGLGWGFKNRRPKSKLTGPTLEFACERGTMCQVRVFRPSQPPMMVQVFAMEEVVEVDVGPCLANAFCLNRAAYRDPKSASAALGAIADAAHKLQFACVAEPRETEEAAALQRELLRARSDQRAMVRNMATLALAEGRCVPMPEDEAVTEAVLALDLHDPAVWWWPSGYVAAARGVEPERGWSALEAAVEAAPTPESGAWMLSSMRLLAKERGDEAREQVVLARLSEAPYASTHEAQGTRMMAQWENRFAVDIGDPMPRMRLAAFESDEVLDTGAQPRRTLYYVTSLRCGSCKRNLPALRSFAEAHPEVDVVVLVMDEEPEAPAKLVEKHSPIPGVVVQPDAEARKVIDAELLRTMVYPSFVLTDSNGRVAAISTKSGFEEMSEQLDKERGGQPRAQR